MNGFVNRLKVSWLLSFLLTSTTGVYAQNLLNLNDWIAGEGPVTGFSLNGLNIENRRDWGITPHGDRSVLWEARPSGDGNADGGFISSDIVVNSLKTYRYSVWVKKFNSKTGKSFLGTSAVNNLDGSLNSNPYFWYGEIPELDRWYLLVGYVHGSNDNSVQNFGGVFDGVSGKKVFSATDFKFVSGVNHTKIRSFLFYDSNVNNIQYFYGPRIEEVNGNEPTIASLINNANRAENFYFAGKVGIKTDLPGEYELAVKGKVRSQEIKVEASNWPDYVFENGYKLPRLQEVNKFISKYKHLPGIPTTEEVEKNGVFLGEMNRLLLEKIEELTLHLIQKDKEISQLKDDVENIKKLINF